jgi:hypothetical protein
VALSMENDSTSTCSNDHSVYGVESAPLVTSGVGRDASRPLQVGRGHAGTITMDIEPSLRTVL